MLEFLEWLGLAVALPLCVFGAIAYLVGRSIAKDTDDDLNSVIDFDGGSDD